MIPFPFATDIFQLQMGLHALDFSALLEIEPEVVEEQLALKRELLERDHASYLQASDASLAAQWDVVALLAPLMAWRFPAQVALVPGAAGTWHWHSAFSHQVASWRFGLPTIAGLAPLDWLGRQIQEDLLILADRPEEGFPLIAGSLCFPNDWSVGEKLGRSILDIHAPVPGFATELGKSTVRLFERLKVGHPVWRLNWSIKATPRLNLIPLYAAENRAAAGAMTAEHVGIGCWLRVERQTLTRLPQSLAILFTVHTYQATLQSAAATPEEAARIAANLRTAPPELLAYKGITPLLAPLLEYLDRVAARNHAPRP